ncbi:hypothetical protein [Rhizobium laguerreae]|uniref:hypothetical protein n=1 Tax=Rhizobium laguerreae TaxID=1076926 RepID=UPI00103FEE2B|nr:hypothetical protein [Rhizobium laguerreae]TBY02496.1 hypothetical protein E0J21_26825 [Rhizobium laguerreae]
MALVAETPSAIASRLRSLCGRYDQAARAAAPFEIINKADLQNYYKLQISLLQAELCGAILDERHKATR